jgi:hypothetical protein
MSEGSGTGFGSGRTVLEEACMLATIFQVLTVADKTYREQGYLCNKIASGTATEAERKRFGDRIFGSRVFRVAANEQLHVYEDGGQEDKVRRAGSEVGAALPQRK